MPQNIRCPRLQCLPPLLRLVGFRPGRSAKDAVRQVQEHIRQGYRIAVDIDLAKFFDTVNFDGPGAQITTYSIAWFLAAVTR